MGYIILGCPRSGTNLLSNLLRIPDKTIVQIEPFSMHSGAILKWDLVKTSPVRYSIINRMTEHPLRVNIKSFLIQDRFRFVKETSLFEHLDILSDVLSTNNIIYIERDIKSVINSYIKHDFFNKWNLSKRIYYQLWKKDYDKDNKLSLEEIVNRYAENVTLKKRYYWDQYKIKYNYIKIEYEDLISDPYYTLKNLFISIDLDIKYIDKILSERRICYKRDYSYEYATFSSS